MSFYLLLFGLGLMTSVAVIFLGIMFSRYLQIVDYPDDLPEHEVGIPFIGGLGILGATLVVVRMTYSHTLINSTEAFVIASGVSILFIIGLADDLWRWGYTTRFLIQGLMACLMVYGGGIVLTDLGEIVPGVTVKLGSLGLFLTIFATLGVINTLKMIDGIDGLAGSMALVSLLLLAIAMLGVGQPQFLILLTALISGLIGFLGFNLRCRLQGRILASLGNNGSMVLGFLLAWLLIGASQGPTRVIMPVTTLWLFAVPLIDAVAILIRRIGLGQPLFHPDRFHLHHLLLRVGFSPADTVLLIVLLQGLFGVIGLAGLYGGVGEWLMFFGFFGIAAGYAWAVFRPGRCLRAFRRLHRWRRLGRGGGLA